MLRTLGLTATSVGGGSDEFAVPGYIWTIGSLKPREKRLALLIRLACADQSPPTAVPGSRAHTRYDLPCLPPGACKIVTCPQ